MACSVSRQDESNPALWLATRAGKIELSCSLGTTRHVPQEKFPRKPHKKSFIDQACSVKKAGYWPCSCFCEFMDRDSLSVHKLAKKELGQYPAILTSHLVNNPYLLCLVYVALKSICDNLHWAWHKLIFCQPEMENWVLSKVAGLVFFVVRKSWEICDILPTALLFAMSNKVNLFPSVVQIVFSNL